MCFAINVYPDLLFFRAVYNPVEADLIASLCDTLLSRKVSPMSIGIITPYRRQVNEIEKLLERLL